LEVGGDYTLKAQKEGSNAFLFMSYKTWSVDEVQIQFADGTEKHKDVTGKTLEKAWAYVNRLLQRKAFADACLENDEVQQPLEWGFKGPSLGGKIRNTVKGHDVYHKATAEIVERYRDAFNAVVIFPGSWIDTKLQEAYNSNGEQPQEGQDE
jgi:hypothetical protein